MTPREELMVCLDEEHAQAFVEHRQRLRKPLTAFAAKLIAKKLAQVPDPNLGIEMAIERGWLGFEPAWFFDALAKLKLPITQQPTQAVMDKYAARTVSISQFDDIYGLLPKRPTNRDGSSYYTPEEVAAVKGRLN